MRVLLTLLLCFIVAFQGGVSAQPIPYLCPINSGDVSSASASINETAHAVGDCCNDAETAAKTGKLCKADTPCGSFNACVFVSFRTPISSAQASSPVPALTALITSFNPSGIWRPPSLS